MTKPNEVPEEQQAVVAESEEWFRERGYDLHLTKEVTGWFAAFVRHDVKAGTAPFGSGDTPVAAVRDARREYLARPELHYRPHPDDASS